MAVSRIFVAFILLSACIIICTLLYVHTFIRTTFHTRSLSTPKISVVLAPDLLESKSYENNGHVVNVDREARKYGATCSCKGKTLLSTASKERRRVELEDWERLHAVSNEPLVRCPALSPFRFIGNGITVQPLESTKLYGLSLSGAIPNDSLNVSKIQLTSRSSLGVLYINHEAHRLNIVGNKTAELTITVNGNVETINELLSTIRYESTVYSVESRDIISVSWMSFHVSIHVHIKRQERPFLYDPGESGNINAKVTVVAKTFERYPAVKRLISSIHKFYPGITILIADDSEFPEKIKAANVKHYIMPFAEGWFAGRNLLVSQIRTKYFLWVDDDFVFTNGTVLERFVEKFEHPNVTVDHVGGTFGDEFGRAVSKSDCYGCRIIKFQYGDEEGDCLHIRSERKYHKVTEFPQCFWADGTTNFFMARTSTVRKSGFDPFFERSGHSEYFIDSLGKLRVMGCTDVNVMHKRDRSSAKYNKMRRTNPSAEKIKHVSFKNNLKCI